MTSLRDPAVLAITCGLALAGCMKSDTSETAAPLSVSHGGETEEARNDVAPSCEVGETIVEEQVETEPVPATQRGAKLEPKE